MNDQAMQVPLVELLARVPADARLVYEHSSIDHSFIPVGRYCNEAAAVLRELEADAARWRTAKKMFVYVSGRYQFTTEAAAQMHLVLAGDNPDAAIDAARGERNE